MCVCVRVFIIIFFIAVCKEFGVTGFPTLQMFQHGEAIKYTGSRSLSSLLEFANEHSG